ncbi:hypothetical protein KXS11_13165 [Plantibacter flavus]|uniref:hypothetical protein n=1 Tax=Plantibacter flavus TaxID=150123 RepID=UPI003F16C699
MDDPTSDGACRRALRTALVTALLGLGCALTACGTTPGGTAPQLTLELRQNRDQYAIHAAIVRVTNPGDADVVVSRVALGGSAFDGGTDRERTSTIPAGQTKDLAVDLPPADCDTAEDALQADVVLTLSSGATVRYTDLADPTAALPRVHAADCTEGRVAQIAVVTAEPVVRLEGTGPTTVAILTLTVTPTGGPGTLELVRLRSTVMLQPAPGSDGTAAAEDWPLDVQVDASSDPRSFELRVVPTRCDPHALAEDKVGTLFPLVVRIDGGAETSLTLPLPPGTADALKDAVRERCA